jgi:GNAT superfamily N-acetyltransferase
MKPAIDWQFSEPDWARYLEDCPHATIFHHPGWYRSHSEADEVILCPHFQWDDGNHAILPMLIRPKYKGLIQEASAGAQNGYGGLVAPRALSPEHVDTAYSAVRKRFPNFRAYGNPFEAFVNTPSVGPHSKRLEAFTQVLPILEPEAQRKLMNETQQKHCKRAEKHGFRFEVIAGLTPAHVATFYDLYEAHSATWSYRRWVRDRPYFENLLSNLGPHLVLFLAWSEDRLSGFRLVGSYGGLVTDLYLATDKDASKSHVGPYLIERPLAWCHAHGYRNFDFMPSGNLAGVITYKASFGAQALPLVEVIHENRVGHTLAYARALAKRDVPSIGSPVKPAGV